MKGLSYVIIAILCFALGALGMYLILHGSSSKLSDDLARVRSDLAKSESIRADIAEQLRLVHGQLDRASELATGQKSIIDAQKRGLAKLAEDISGSGGDIGKQIHAFAEGFRHLYSLYNPGPGGR